MRDKQKSVTNFLNAIDVFNSWASKGNRHSIVTEDKIQHRILKERQIYVD